MTLGDHLRELRRRVVISAVAILALAVFGWIYYEHIYDALAAPFNDYKNANPLSTISLNFGNATAAFSQQVSLSLFTGVIGASPVWLWQVWRFIVPGLKRKERNISLAFVAAIVPLFLAGCALAYFVLPSVLSVLYGFSPPESSNIQQVADYFAFVTRFILAFGGAFLMPVFLVALNTIGILPARMMVKAWRVAVFGIFALSAILTPTPDAFTMMLMAAPLTVLYFGAIGVCLLIERSKKRKRPDWSEVPDDQASPL